MHGSGLLGVSSVLVEPGGPVRHRIAAFLLFPSVVVLAACERRASPPEVVATPASADMKVAGSAVPAETASGSATAAPEPSAAPGGSTKRGSAFVRHPPHSNNSDADA